MDTKKKNIHLGLLTFIFIVLMNPQVNVIDVFPDFIAWFLFAWLLGSASGICPYFYEARNCAIKVGLVSVLKCFSIFITLSSSGQDGNTDTVALFAFSFAVVEMIFLIPFINNLFEGLFYLGERSDCNALIKSTGSLNPENLQKLVVVFFITRSVLSFLPEFLRLSSASDTAAIKLSKATLYPKIVVACCLVVFAIGLYVVIKAYRYCKAISVEGKFYQALDIMQEENVDSEEKKDSKKQYYAFFRLLFIASFFTITLAFNDFSDFDILPLFMFGVFSFFAMLRIQNTVVLARKAKYVALGFTVVSLTSYAVLGKFLKTYGYYILEKSEEANRFFNYCRGLSIAESIAGIVLVVFICKTVNQVILCAMGNSQDSPNYSIADRSFHREMMRKNLVLAIFCGLLIVSSTVGLFLNGHVVVTELDPSRIPEGVTTSSIKVAGGLFPAFGSIQVLVGAVFVYVLSFIFDIFKREVKAKADAEAKQ